MEENNIQQQNLNEMKQSLINKQNIQDEDNGEQEGAVKIDIKEIAQEVVNEDNIKKAKNVLNFIDLFRSYDTNDFDLKYDDGRIVLKKKNSDQDFQFTINKEIAENIDKSKQDILEFFKGKILSMDSKSQITQLILSGVSKIFTLNFQSEQVDGLMEDLNDKFAQLIESQFTELEENKEIFEIVQTLFQYLLLQLSIRVLDKLKNLADLAKLPNEVNLESIIISFDKQERNSVQQQQKEGKKERNPQLQDVLLSLKQFFNVQYEEINKAILEKKQSIRKSLIMQLSNFSLKTIVDVKKEMKQYMRQKEQIRQLKLLQMVTFIIPTIIIFVSTVVQKGKVKRLLEDVRDYQDRFDDNKAVDKLEGDLENMEIFGILLQFSMIIFNVYMYSYGFYRQWRLKKDTKYYNDKYLEQENQLSEIEQSLSNIKQEQKKQPSNSSSSTQEQQKQKELKKKEKELHIKMKKINKSQKRIEKTFGEDMLNIKEKIPEQDLLSDKNIKKIGIGFIVAFIFMLVGYLGQWTSTIIYYSRDYASFQNFGMQEENEKQYLQDKLFDHIDMLNDISKIVIWSPAIILPVYTGIILTISVVIYNKMQETDKLRINELLEKAL